MLRVGSFGFEALRGLGAWDGDDTSGLQKGAALPI
jgi:hypothetical protein